MAKHKLRKLPRADREVLRRVAFGGASEADRRRYLLMDDTDQALRDARAVGLRMGRRAKRAMEDRVLSAFERTIAGQLSS